jgi:pyruvate formate lyase activating enzyme
MAFTHLHLHTEFSLLDGACRINKLMDHLNEIGQKSVAITDHGVMYGVIDFYKAAKEKGINTCIDTAGGPFKKDGEWFEKFRKLMDVTDILLMDIKHIDEQEHIKLTGQSGKNIIEMFRYLDEIKKPIWIRHVLTPGITDNDEYLLKTRDFIRTLSNVQRVEILPYHGLGAMKYKDLGLEYELKDTESPSAQRVANARAILECDKYNGWKE